MERSNLLIRLGNIKLQIASLSRTNSPSVRNERRLKETIMKKLILIILTIHCSLFTIHSFTQLPNFIKVDTGAITQFWGGHVSSTCFDMDNDGDQDLFVGNSAVYANSVFSIYKNKGNGFFVEMPAFITNLDYGQVSSFGDIDNDGDIDLVLSPNNPLKIYANDGNGNFQYHAAINLTYSTLYPTLLDLDADGYLDVMGIDRQGSVSYNNGEGGFLGPADLGLFQPQQNVLLHSVSWGDVDNDGDFDFYGGYSATNTNAIPVNVCCLNNGNGSFVQFDPTSVIVGDTCNTLCVNWVDYDNDGDMDLYVHNIGCDNSLPVLYENLGDMEFTRHDFIDEIYRYSQASSAVWGDLDNDADLDLYITVENNVNPFTGDTSATPFNVLYLNDGNGQFTNYLEDNPLVLEDSHTAMLFDHDNDGDLDVLLTRYSWSNDGTNNILVNEGNDNSWIVLTCKGTTSNNTAIGTQVQAKVFVNGKHITQTREITPINGHLSYANLRVHFGLGDAEKIDTLIIRWPSGLVDTYFDVEANRFYIAHENHFLSPVGLNDHLQNLQHFNLYPNPLTSTTTIEYELTSPENISIIIYNHLGVQIKVIEKKHSQGKQEVLWNAGGLPAGIYFCALKTDNGIQTQKIIKL